LKYNDNKALMIKERNQTSTKKFKNNGSKEEIWENEQTALMISHLYLYI